jgi:hypothetical protein
MAATDSFTQPHHKACPYLPYWTHIYIPSPASMWTITWISFVLSKHISTVLFLLSFIQTAYSILSFTPLSHFVSLTRINLYSGLRTCSLEIASYSQSFPSNFVIFCYPPGSWLSYHALVHPSIAISEAVSSSLQQADPSVKAKQKH